MRRSASPFQILLIILRAQTRLPQDLHGPDSVISSGLRPISGIMNCPPVTFDIPRMVISKTCQRGAPRMVSSKICRRSTPRMVLSTIYHPCNPRAATSQIHRQDSPLLLVSELPRRGIPRIQVASTRDRIRAQSNNQATITRHLLPLTALPTATQERGPRHIPPHLPCLR
ncbi:hypothetical protein B0H14DRAFT_1250243 [Mycena olivaceomarginata]|nr:hypothetical protein B0H14DRAFT_1250243 [Mycena olivaceomarginata]